MARNMFKIIDETAGTVPVRYDLTMDELAQLIYDASSKNVTFNAIISDAIINAFRYGFALGVRSERNKAKRG